MHRIASALLSMAAVSCAIAEDDTYKQHIEPILSTACYDCHGSAKQKGGLRLDSPGAIRAGGKNGAVVLAGDPEKSPLYERISLPADDDDIMPAKGDPLDSEQIKLIHDWIKSGASFGDGAAPAVAAHGAQPVKPWSNAEVETDLDAASAGVSAVDDKTIAELDALGIWARHLSKNKGLIELDYSQVNGALTPEQLQPLATFARHIAWLDCAGASLTDADMQRIAELINLRRLHLERTRITDAGLAQLKDLKQLEYLNLYGTTITDAGLAALSGMSKLKNLYLWKTKASAAGVERLREALPNLAITFGD